MARRHGSTAKQRVAWVSQLLGGSGTYGLVTLLSREAGVSRQTLYVWAEQGRQALEQAFEPREAERTIGPELERQVLSLLVETHASVRGIQTSLWQVARRRVGQGTISAIIQEAQRRAQAWMSQHAPASERPLALDEMYGNDRRGAYLHIVDTASHAVWAAEGPGPGRYRELDAGAVAGPGARAALAHDDQCDHPGGAAAGAGVDERSRASVVAATGVG